MEKRIESVIFKGFINKSLTVSYIYNLHINDKYASIEEDDRGQIKIYPTYLIQLNPGYSDHQEGILHLYHYLTKL